mgnify:CR=1 FL=1
MKIENIDTAMRFKERREKLLEAKEVIERNPSSIIVELRNGTYGNKNRVVIQEDILTGIIYKYLEDTIALLEKNIEQL